MSLSRNIWNIADVLQCMKSLGPLNVLLSTLLLSEQLCQTIHSLKIIDMNTSDDRVLFPTNLHCHNELASVETLT